MYPIQDRSQPSRWGGGGLNLDRWNTGADTGFPEGGGGEDIQKHPPPLDIVRDVIRPPEN